MDPIDFGGQRSKVKVTGQKLKINFEPYYFGEHSSKVKVTMVIIDKCGVRGMLRFALLYFLWFFFFFFFFFFFAFVEKKSVSPTFRGIFYKDVA